MHALVGLVETFDLVPRAVGAAIVDEDDLPPAPATVIHLEWVQARADLVHELADRVDLILDRHKHRDVGRHAGVAEARLGR